MMPDVSTHRVIHAPKVRGSQLQSDWSNLGLMRFFSCVVVVCCASSASWAQATGTWTGYVNGWVKDQPQHVAPFIPGQFTKWRISAEQQQYLLWRQWTAQEAFVAQQYAQQTLQTAAAAQRELALQERVQRAELEVREQQLAREKEAHLQQLMAQQVVTQQQQALAEQQQREAEAARAAAESQLRQLEQERQQKAAREVARAAVVSAEAAARPREKGPDIHRWVDEEGVVHYSTRAKPSP